MKFEFYGVKTTRPAFALVLDLPMAIHNKKPLPILWDCNGLFRTIPLERVKNMIDAIGDSKNLSPIAKDRQVGKFYWEDGIDVDPKVAKILLSNQQ